MFQLTWAASTGSSAPQNLVVSSVNAGLRLPGRPGDRRRPPWGPGSARWGCSLRGQRRSKVAASGLVLEGAPDRSAAARSRAGIEPRQYSSASRQSGAPSGAPQLAESLVSSARQRPGLSVKGHRLWSRRASARHSGLRRGQRRRASRPPGTRRAARTRAPGCPSSAPPPAASRRWDPRSPAPAGRRSAVSFLATASWTAHSSTVSSPMLAWRLGAGLPSRAALVGVPLAGDVGPHRARAEVVPLVEPVGQAGAARSSVGQRRAWRRPSSRFCGDAPKLALLVRVDRAPSLLFRCSRPAPASASSASRQRWIE